MPLAQDHKRLLEGDCGLNTGGMGAIALGTQASLRQAQEWAEKFLLPVITGLQEDSVQYRGVLYAGLILTSQGPKVLEYNCRFGDPETQAILPLLDSDLLELLTACAEGRLSAFKPKWKDEASASIVLTSSDYAQDVKTFGDSIIRDFGGHEKNSMIFMPEPGAKETLYELIGAAFCALQDGMFHYPRLWEKPIPEFPESKWHKEDIEKTLASTGNFSIIWKRGRARAWPLLPLYQLQKRIGLPELILTLATER